MIAIMVAVANFAYTCLTLPLMSVPFYVFILLNVVVSGIASFLSREIAVQ